MIVSGLDYRWGSHVIYVFDLEGCVIITSHLFFPSEVSLTLVFTCDLSLYRDGQGTYSCSYCTGTVITLVLMER